MNCADNLLMAVYTILRDLWGKISNLMSLFSESFL